MTRLSDEQLYEAVALYREHGTERAAAEAAGLAPSSFHNRLMRAAERGLMGTEPVIPGFAIKSIASKMGDAWVRQVRAPGEEYVTPAGQALRAQSVLADADNRVLLTWHKTDRDAAQREVAMRAVVDALKADLPRAAPVSPPVGTAADLLNLYAVTDAHFGMLAWHEETGADYDLVIAEKLLLDWFAAAIDLAPAAEVGILAQIGDLLHYDGFESKTPTSGHILDADSRLPKVIRVVIRTLRRVIAMLLAKHGRVHVIMADANHDPASEAWLREMFSAFYDEESRVTVDRSAGTYYAYEHGAVSLFFHHGHKRKIGNVDSVFAGKYREAYGRTKFSYAHLGHLHSDELKSTNLMKVERHETLAAPDAYASNGGWLSGRSAKVITYSKQYGEVARLTLTPGMVGGGRTPANDNKPMEMVA